MISCYSLSTEATASLIAGTRLSDLLWNEARSVFIKVESFSPLASHKKVMDYRKAVMAMKRDDWKFEEKTIIQEQTRQEQG